MTAGTEIHRPPFSTLKWPGFGQSRTGDICFAAPITASRRLLIRTDVCGGDSAQPGRNPDGPFSLRVEEDILLRAWRCICLALCCRGGGYRYRPDVEACFPTRTEC